MDAQSGILEIAGAALAKFGPDAAVRMRRRAEEHAAAGELEGAEVWRRIADAVVERLESERPEGIPTDGPGLRSRHPIGQSARRVPASA